MNWWNRLSTKGKQELYVPVSWSSDYSKDGLLLRLFRGEQMVSLPLNLSVTELRQQSDLETLELLESLWYEEWLEERDSGYLFPYEKLMEAPIEVLQILGIPEPVSMDLKVGHEGAVGTSRFTVVLEKHYKGWKHLERTAKAIGPWLMLPDRSCLLMEPGQYRFQCLLDQAPNPTDRERIFPFVAQVRKEAMRQGISMDSYLEQQEYLFVDSLELDVGYDGQEIQITPVYTSEDPIPAPVLEQLSKQNAIYATDEQRRKIFVHPDLSVRSNSIRNIPPIQGQDIPRFAENPEAYLPEIEGIDLALFGERVRSLGIRVYRAQPYVHASEKQRGWFELDLGVSVVDENGERHGELEPAEFDKLVGGARDSGQDYFEWNGSWLRVPQDTESFNSAAERLRQTWGDRPQVDITKLPYVLEIFENIGQLEFNQPILEAQRDMIDQGILDRKPPVIFDASLKPFQEDGYVWMKSLHYRKLGGLLADDMGLGKTIQVVSLLAYLNEVGKLSPTLIVVPKTLIDNWEAEIKKFAQPLLNSFYIHSGGGRNKDPEKLSKKGITITTYQTLVRDQLALGQVNWQAIICDEAQAIKNPTTAASKVIKAMKSKFRLALTGTPVENGLSELWSILDYVQPGLLGSLSEFKREYIDKLEVHERDAETEQKLLARISMVYKRRTKSEELAGQIPTKTKVEVPIPLGSAQKQIYSEVITQVRSKKMTALQAIQVLRALCSHPALVDDRLKDIPIADVPKLQKTLEIMESIRQKGEKVLIFTDLRRMQELLRSAIRDRFDLNPNIINGMTERRQDLVDEFNRISGFDVMILSPKAAGTGLTITSANHVIHYTRWWNPAVENQATDRVYRIGQERPVTVYYPIVEDQDGALKAGTVEQIVNRILSEKQDLASSIIVSSRTLDLENEVMAKVFG
jgi:superfamily II DNA or RNA helicase